MGESKANGLEAPAGTEAPPSTADVVLSGITDPLEEGLLLGDGRTVALMYRRDAAIVYNLTRNDVWDQRLASALDAPLMPTREWLDAMAALQPGERADRARLLEQSETDSYSKPYPCPLLCARLVVELPRAPLPEEHRLALGAASVESRLGPVSLRSYVHATAGVLVLEGVPAAARVRVEAVPQADLPAPLEGGGPPLGDGAAWLRQVVPGDADIPAFSYVVYLLRRGSRAVVAVVRRDDGGLAGGPGAAPEPVEAAAAEDTGALQGAHRAWWQRFWAVSGVRLQDEQLERLWYRNLYFLASVNRPGCVPAGLFAGLSEAAPAWHGDYHLNYNFQQQYWGAYPANHAELAEPYDRLILDYLPRARWLARTLFGVEGAYYPHVVYLGEPPDPERCAAPRGRQFFHHVWGRTLGVTAFAVQNLWWRYLYTQDEAVLAAVYPAIREAARFFVNWHAVTRALDGSDDLYPTVSPEHWGLTEGLERNRNCTFDLAMLRFLLRAFSQAASRLRADDDLRAACADLLGRLPPYPRATAPAGEVLVDVAGAPPITYNIPVPATPVFPGEDVGWWSPLEERALLARSVASLQTNGNNDLVMAAVARARLGSPDAVSFLKERCAAQQRPNGTLRMCRDDNRFNRFGHYTEMFGVGLAVSELLLQAHDGVLRLFPQWPREWEARFTGLRAPGGCVVGASWARGALQWATVAPVRPGPVALAEEAGPLEVRDGDGNPVRVSRADGPAGLRVIRWDARAGAVYRVQPLSGRGRGAG